MSLVGWISQRALASSLFWAFFGALPVQAYLHSCFQLSSCTSLTGYVLGYTAAAQQGSCGPSGLDGSIFLPGQEGGIWTGESCPHHVRIKWEPAVDADGGCGRGGRAGWLFKVTLSRLLKWISSLQLCLKVVPANSVWSNDWILLFDRFKRSASQSRPRVQTVPPPPSSWGPSRWFRWVAPKLWKVNVDPPAELPTAAKECYQSKYSVFQKKWRNHCKDSRAPHATGYLEEESRLTSHQCSSVSGRLPAFSSVQVKDSSTGFCCLQSGAAWAVHLQSPACF